MKKSVVLLFCLLPIALLLLASVSAYVAVPAPSPNLPVNEPPKTMDQIVQEKGVIGAFFMGNDSLFNKAMKFLIGSNLSEYGTSFIVWLAIWIVILVFVSDILMTFSALSSWSAWTIGFAVAVIAGASGFVSTIVMWSLGLTAILGTFSLVIVSATAFLAAAVLHIGVFGKLTKWALQRQAMLAQVKGIKGGAKVEAAIENLAKIQESLNRAG